ncbi:MAG: ABC transporter permease [Deltaproteobacteria bacterium]|nr:ABC transporter permease [Deltaproteobacteria bacterium]
MTAVSKTLTLHAVRTGRNLFGVCEELRRNPAALISGLVVILYVVMAIFAPWVAPFQPNESDLTQRLLPPDSRHWFGTDALGRDILSRTIYGARVSILVGLLSVGLCVLFGVSLGLVAGYYRGWLDTVLSRFSELLMAFPYLISAIGMMAFLGPGFWNLVWALALRGWVEFFRMARGETFSQATREYVEAARSLGQPGLRIMLSEILPNITASVIVLATLRVGFLIVLEASLSFLGVGVPPTIPAWGSMISEGRNVLFIAWWVSTIPGLVLVALVLAINLLGEGLREVLDPRLKLQT